MSHDGSALTFVWVLVKKVGMYSHVRRPLLNGGLAGIALLGLAWLQTGCNKTETSAPQTNSTATKQAKSSYTIGMSQCNLGEPWRVEMNARIKAAADKHPNLKVVFKDAQNDTLKQRAHVEEFVSAARDDPARLVYTA